MRFYLQNSKKFALHDSPDPPSLCGCVHKGLRTCLSGDSLVHNDNHGPGCLVVKSTMTYTCVACLEVHHSAKEVNRRLKCNEAKHHFQLSRTQVVIFSQTFWNMNSRHHTFSSLVWTGLVRFCALFTDAVSSVWSLSVFFLRTTAVTDPSLQYDIGDDNLHTTCWSCHVYLDFPDSALSALLIFSTLTWGFVSL